MQCWSHLCNHIWCTKCKKHYTKDLIHRCFNDKDHVRRSIAEDSSFASDSHSDSESENEYSGAKRPKIETESKHFAYDVESMFTSVSQHDGTLKDLHTVILIVVRQLYSESEDESSYLIFQDLESL